MKNVLSVLVLLTGLNAMAAAPKMTCELDYDLLSPEGATLEVKHVPTQTLTAGRKITIENNGFVLEANIQQVCAVAAGGGFFGGGNPPCFDAYDLNITIKNGENYAHTSRRTPFQDTSANLKLGNERGWVICRAQN